MNKAAASSKLRFKDFVIIVGLLIILAFILFEPISTSLNMNLNESKTNSRDSVEQVSKRYQRCIERADSSLGGYDRMAGTSYSNENIAARDREQCTRDYNLEMRVLKRE
ncbi:MAG: hypothetical protein WAQ22_01210 [Candidatus Saccharimonas sp.]